MGGHHLHFVILRLQSQVRIINLMTTFHLQPRLCLLYNVDGVIGERISNAWKTFWKNKIFLKNKMKTKLKIKILESCVISVLTCKVQVWSLTNRQVQRLTTPQNAMIRSILSIRLKDKMLVNNSKRAVLVSLREPPI